jgi:hypothetical protein
MTPEQTGVTLIVELISKLGTTPILLFLAVVILGPSVTIAVAIWMMNKMVGKMQKKQDDRMTLILERQDKRFEQVVRMYEDNIYLVKSHETLSEKLQDLVILTTSTLQTLVEYIKNNIFCPLVKQRTRPNRIEGD